MEQDNTLEGEVIYQKRTPKKRGRRFDKRKLAARKEGQVATANQWQADERQLSWLNYYMNPREEATYANPYQAAIKAGYSESYARNIMNPALAVQWVQSARNIMRTMNPEHIRNVLEEITMNNMEKTADRIAAAKLLGTEQGMFVQKQITAHVPLEQALNELE